MSSLPSNAKSVKVGKRLSPELRREQLLDCAIKAYAELGVERAGHGDVAKLARVSTATVFNYFPTRRELTDAVFDKIRTVNRALFEAEPTNSEDAKAAMYRLVAAYSTLIREYPDLIKVSLNWSVSFGETVRPQFLEFQNEMLDLLVKHLPAIDAKAHGRSEARIVYGAATTIAMMILDKAPEDAIARFISRVADAILHSSISHPDA